MKVRRLQTTDNQSDWYNDAYALEDEQGRVVFHYNLGWERIGSYYNGQLQESGVTLAEIERVINPGKAWRWQLIEEVAAEEAEAFLEALNEACAIPKPRSIAHKLDHTLTT